MLYIEGLVHVTALPGDYYRFDPAHQRLVGERSGRSFQLGDKLSVQVARVDLDDKKIDLEPVELPATGKAARSRRGGQGGNRDSGSDSGRSSGKGGSKGSSKGKGSRGKGAAPAAAKPARKAKNVPAAESAPARRQKGDRGSNGKPAVKAGQKGTGKPTEGKKSSGQRRRRRR